ncbi:MAG: hypothetical protein IKD66_00945, partial [Solobacterium sp.]|nr:hypothetical protein [Solobacterium sp.]
HNLFLAGATGGSVADGYIIQWGDTPLGNGTIQKGKTMSYVYDSDTKNLYTESELTLSDSNYEEHGEELQAPEIISGPEDAAAAIGEKAQFHVTAEGEGLTYQWQLSRDNGINWVNLNGTKFPSALTADFEITGSKMITLSASYLREPKSWTGFTAEVRSADMAIPWPDSQRILRVRKRKSRK